jgi:hypothetical protein
VDRRLAAALAAGQLDGAVGDDLVGVHVRLGAAAGLPDAEREVVVELAGDDLVGGAGDEVGAVGRHLAQVAVDQGAGLLEDAEGAEDRPRHAVGADGEVDQRARRLRAVVAVGGHLDGAHAVLLDACRAHGWLVRRCGRGTRRVS